MGHVYIVAEVGVNHNGSLERAKEMIETAARAGVDAVKFQLFSTGQLMVHDAPKAPYQLETTGISGSQYDMTKIYELSHEDQVVLQRECRLHKVDFLSTPFDEGSLQVLVDICDVSTLKIPSGEITNARFLMMAGGTGRKIILSTGMSTLGEVEMALGVLAYGATVSHVRVPADCRDFLKAFSSDEGQVYLQEHVMLMHCTTEYPAPFDSVNLCCMDTLRDAFRLPVGYSDHTPGIAIALAAAARGAAIIEKHFTLSRNLPGPDQKASIEPSELRELVSGVRQIELSLGNGIKIPSEAEERNIDVVRKSLVAQSDIHAEEVFSETNLTAKRPGTGISPMRYGEFLGRKAGRDYRKDEMIQFE